ncbi:MAG: alpha-keto acid decarboxylase family protein [Planctomycetaceae bacterium]|nr:alpha-keto acid decarboxylase family protein [Planctomycetaceae bacterium]
MAPKKKPTRAARSSNASQAPAVANRKNSRRSSDSTPSSNSTTAAARMTIGGYLIQRLQDYGVRDIFGIPGDFVLQFYGMLEDSPINVVGTTNEACAGYAADGYARINGIGAVCVTYCVGGLSLCNAVAGAYAEKSPVIVISGSPGMSERRSDPLLHHRVRDFNTQRDVFEKITVATASLEDELTAFREIDRCLEACVRFKRPVFLEIPRDKVLAEATHAHVPVVTPLVSDPDALQECLKEARESIHAAKRPVIIAGVETHRFGLREQVLELAEANNIPICATLLGKSVVSEKHPLYLGVYEGAMGRDEVRRYVEESDCVILLGAFMTDINLGIFTARLDPGRCIYATSEKLRIRHHHFHDVLFTDFVTHLASKKIGPVRAAPKVRPPEVPAWSPKNDQPITIRRLFQKINSLLDQSMVVVADTGDSMFAAADLSISRHTEFLSTAYYTSMGFSIPASVGVQVANRNLRPLVLVGDGAFQMTCMELSTTVRRGFNPIVIVLNNKGYSTERFIQEGPFNDIHNWNYHRMPELLGAGWGFEVRTEGDLEKAIKAAIANQDSFSLLNVHLEKLDVSPALKRLAERLADRI